MLQATPPIGSSLVFLAVGAASFVPVARFAQRWLARPALPAARWRPGEVLAIAALPFVLVGLVGKRLAEASFLEYLLVNELVFAVTAVLIVVLARRRAHGLDDLGILRRPSPAAVLAGPLGYVPLFLTMAGVGGLWRRLGEALGWPTEQEVLRAMLDLEGGALVVGAIVAVLIGPLLEELLFRGFLQSVLARPLGTHGSVAVTALLFSLLHGRSTLGPLLCLSLYLGWLRARSGSLWVSWVVHALHNGVNLALVLSIGSG